MIFYKRIIKLLISLIPCCLSGCYDGPQENCVYIGERANLHSEYYAQVISINELDNVFVYKNEGDEEKSELIGTTKHFIEAKVLIEHQKVAKPKENHALDCDDFRLKDHTGIEIKNVNIFSAENGVALQTTDFTTTEAIADYSWFGTQIVSGESKEMVLYFEVPKGVSVFKDIAVLEIDFIAGRSGHKKGTDFLLTYREVTY